MQPLIEKLEEIFGDFKESGVSLIDEEVQVEAVGAENDDNEGLSKKNSPPGGAILVVEKW